jgi:phage terminase small subunit
VRTLNYRQRLFLCHYLGQAKGDATKAAALAGYRNPSAGSQILKHPVIAHAIKAKLESAAMPVDEVLARLSEIATADIFDFLDVDPTTGDATFDARKAKKSGKSHLIKKFKKFGPGQYEIELHDPHDALKDLAKIHGLYQNRLEVTHRGAESESVTNIIAILGGISQLTGTIRTSQEAGQDQPRSLCHSVEPGEVDSSPTPDPAERPTCLDVTPLD